MVYKLIRVLAAGDSGRDCRRCAQPIVADDPFGASEGVCRPCRG